MPSRFVPAPDLDARVAVLIARPLVERLNEDLRDAARRRAPDVKTWMTVRDERVRRSHVRTDGQTIPVNLRFKVPKVGTGDDPNDIRVGFDLARHPRDPALPIGNRINCRCADPVLVGVLAATIHALPAVLQGTRVVAQTETRFPRAAESENGTTEDTAAYFMRDALREVAARLNVRGHR
jgi:hypothetical protein